jgi:frataxin-like iron-binding protein CyaY
MKTYRWICVVAAAFLPGILAAQDQPKLVPALGWDSTTQGLFVTSVIVDAQNNVWAGTEANGLWRYDSRAKKWAQFTTKDGLGDDNVYALAVDKLGRVWAGHLNHGVSVWNGEKWENFGLLDGPLGDRVFAIATCPTDGDVWIATDCGVARYSLAKDDWDYFTRASGLPTNQVQAIAFDSKGNIFLGTQCDGVAMASASDEYKKWKTVAGPLQMPTAASGDGLPSSLINDIAVVNDDKMILVATQNGVGMSVDGGQKWKYMRGQDWRMNVNGLYDAPADAGGNDAEQINPHPQGQDELLMEDWTTCIRQDEKTKNIWIGHRKVGAEARNADMNKFVSAAGGDAWRYFAKAFCFPQKGPVLVATADFETGGLMTPDNATAEIEPGAEPPKTAPPLPAPAKAADAATLVAMGKYLGAFKTELKSGDGVFLGDDWRTQGDWVGRYGNSFAMICGIDADGIYQGEPGYDVKVGIGPHSKGEGTPESYVSNETSDSARMLYVPSLGHREEAEFNDLSCRDTFPPSWEGPDLWVETTVPAGLHCVSLYFCNNDLHTPGTGLDYSRIFRDYDVQLLSWAEDKDAVQKSAPLARTRVTDFYGGVYKQFIVAGPARYVVRVGRNHSFGAKLQGVFIDRVSDDGPATRKPLPGFDTVNYTPATVKDKSAIEGDPTLSAASALWDTLDQAFGKRGITGLQLPLRIVAYRAAVAGHAPAALLDMWRWQIAIWTKEDREAFDKAIADAFKAYSAKNPPANPGAN